MNSPIRVVCEGCLRSVEFAPDCGPAVEAQCPFCRHRIDSRISEVGSSDAETRIPKSPDGSDTKDPPETIDWAAAWTRGTLGSLGRFQLRERLGDGGFGQVYLAYDPRLDRDVALKVLKQPDPSDRVMERFFREARAVARLDHPNIVAVHDAGFDDGRCWVAYQLVSGRPLWWYRDRQPMDPATAARIIRDLADALSHAHGMGVVHRDIKPGNVMIDDRGRPRLIDFGLARRSDVESDLTRDGVVVGTPAYMSPEQAIGLSKQADERSDVYSLGVLFYELLYSRRPKEVRADSASENPGPFVMREGLPSARSINRTVPKRLDAICAKAMSQRPADRYPSARVLAEAIDKWIARRKTTGSRVTLGVVALLCSIVMAVSAFSVPRLRLKDDAIGARGDSRSPVATSPGPPPTPSPDPIVPGGEAIEARIAPAPLIRGQLIASRKAKRYHIVPCRYVDEIEVSNRVVLASPEAAQKKGFQPCHWCKPPPPQPPSALHDGDESDGP